GAGASGIADTLLAVVAEKTGYPVAMLELGMGLDADLGIDSIKRVEILSSLQERLPTAPVIGPEQLGELHTLADIAAFLGGTSASGASGQDAAAAPATAADGNGVPAPRIDARALDASDLDANALDANALDANALAAALLA